MNTLALFTAEFSTRTCLTLVHSLWQVALLALIAWIVERVASRRFPEVGYVVSSLMLLIALMLLPITYHFLRPTPTPVAHQSPPLDAATPVTIHESHTASLQEVPLDSIPAGTHASAPLEPASPIQETVHRTSTAKPQAMTFDWSRLTPWGVGTYLVGVLWMLIRLANSIRHAQRLAQSGSPITSGPVFKSLQKLGQQWSMSILPKLSVATECVMPKVVGVLKPTILLPASALTGLSEAELEIILLHELAHVRRHDLWMNLFQRLAEVVLFFNPALWWLSHRISTQREYCCDEMVCRTMATMHQDQSDIPRTQYAFTLLRIVELMQGQPPSEPLTTLALSNRAPSELRRRVGRLLGETVHQSVSPSRGGVLFVVTGVFLMMCTALWSTPEAMAKPEDAQPENNNIALVKQLKQECTRVTDTYAGNHRDGHGELTSLSLFKASKAAVDTVSKLEGLKELEFVASDLRNVDFDAIQQLTSLEKLVIMNCQFHPQQMSAFKTLTNLEHLEVIFTVFQESESWRNDQLGVLSEEEQQLSQQLKNDFEVGDHIIQAALLTDRAMPALQNLMKLKTLKLVNTFVSPRGFQHLTPLTRLETLQIGIVGHTPESLNPLLGMKRLKSLHRFDADDAIVEQLSQVTSLQELDIWAGGLTDVGATHLTKLTNLRELSINGNQLTEVGLQKLLTLQNLKELDARGAVISPEAHERLQIPERLKLRGAYSVAWGSVLTKSKNPEGKDLVETRFTGTIVDEAGQPLKEEGILTYDTKFDEHRSASGNAGEFTGRFTFLLPPGKTYLTHYVKGYAPTDVGPFTGEMGQEISNIKIVMKRGVEQRVRVVDETGEPISKATVISHPEFHGTADGFVYPKTTNKNGEYLYEHLAETQYAFNVTAAGFEPLRTGPLDLKPNEVLTLTMTRSQPTTGVVLNLDGTPAAGAKLRAQWEHGERGVGFGNEGEGFWGKVFAITNESGEFVLNQLTTGAQYMFIIEAADGNRLIYRDLKAGQQDMTIKMPPRHNLQVIVKGDLRKLPKRRGKPYVNMRQRCKTKYSDGGTHGDLFGQEIPLTLTNSGATARFNGLAIDPEQQDQVVSVYLGYDYSTKQIVEINKEGDTVVEFDLPPEQESPGTEGSTSSNTQKIEQLVEEAGTDDSLLGKQVADIGIGLNGSSKDALFVDGRPFDEDHKLSEVPALLTKLGYRPDDTLICIRAHSDVPYETIVNLLDELKQNQWQQISLSMASEPFSRFNNEGLIGIWEPTVCDFSGTHSPVWADLNQKWLFGQQTATVIYADGTRESFNYHVEENGNKLHLDLKWTAGTSRAGYPAIGLLEVDQKTMKLGFLINGKDRPTELTRGKVFGLNRGGQYVELKRISTKLPPQEKLSGMWTGERDGIKIKKFEIAEDGTVQWNLSTGKAGIGIYMDKTQQDTINGFIRLQASLTNGPLITGILSDGPGDQLQLDVLPSLHHQHSYNYQAMPRITLTRQPEVAVVDMPSPEPLTQDEKAAANSDVKFWNTQLVNGMTGKPLQGIQVRVNGHIEGREDSQRMTLVSNDQGEIEIPLKADHATSVEVLTQGWFQSGLDLIGNLKGLGVKSDAGVNGNATGPIKLWPGQVVSGRLLYPDETPAGEVQLNVGAYLTNTDWKKRLDMDLRIYSFDHGDWPNWQRRIVTNQDGTFTTTVPPEDSRWWVRVGTTRLGIGGNALNGMNPDGVGAALAKCVPFKFQLGGQNGDQAVIASPHLGQDDSQLYLGDLHLKYGVTVKGRVVDEHGAGLAGVHLTSTGPHGPHSGRSAVTNADGQFEFLPMEPGQLVIHPDARIRDSQGKVVSRDVQAVFVDQTFAILESADPVEITVKAVPTKEWEFEWVDRRQEKGPVSYYGHFPLTGHYSLKDEKTYWHGETQLVSRDDKQFLVIKAPRDLLNPTLMLSADRVVTASLEDGKGEVHGPGRVELNEINSTHMTIYGDEPRQKFEQ